MKKSVRIALGSAALAAGLALATASPANAQVRFKGSFPLPHGRISVGVGGLSVGSYVPESYSVYEDPDYGYGVYDGDQWFSCEQNAGQWIIVGRPVYYANRGYRSVRPYRSFGYRYSQPYRNIDRSFGSRRFENRRFDNRIFDNRRFDNRSFNNRRFDDRSFGNRRRDSWRDGRDDRQSREHDRGWNR